MNMAAMRLIGLSSALVLTAASGFSLAQGLIGPADPELRAAHESLNEAMLHLNGARNAESAAIVRARAYVALAITEIGTGYHSFRDEPAPPPPRAPAPPPPGGR
jgi:hypothetical protein